MPARAVERCDLRRLTCGVGNGPYPGRGPAYDPGLVFTEYIVLNLAKVSQSRQPEAPQGPSSR